MTTERPTRLKHLAEGTAAVERKSSAAVAKEGKPIMKSITPTAMMIGDAEPAVAMVVMTAWSACGLLLF